MASLSPLPSPVYAFNPKGWLNDFVGVLSLFVLVTLQSNSVQAASQPLVLNQSISSLSTASSVYFADKTSQLSIEDIMQSKTSTGEDISWQTVPNNYLSYGYSPNSYWIKTELTNPFGETRYWVWEIDYAFLDEVDLYQVTHKTGKPELIKQYFRGDHRIAKNAEKRQRAPNFHISIPAGETHTFYLRGKSTSTVWLASKVYEGETFQILEGKLQAMLGAFFGIMFAMAMYNIIVYMVIRNLTYLYYVIYVCTISIYFCVVTGFWYQFLAMDNIWLIDHLNGILACATFIFGLLTAIRFLQLEKYATRSARILYGLSAVYGFGIIAVFFVPYHIHILILELSSMITAVTILTISIRQWVRGHASARDYTLAWAPLLVGSIIYNLAILNVLPWNTFTAYFHIFTTALQALLLSIALAKQLSREKEKRLEAQSAFFAKEKQAMAAEAENKAKTEFLAKMSHEIRTPMNGVLGIAQLLKEQGLNPKQDELVDTIYNSGNSLLAIINDILDFSKFESEGFELEEIAFSTNALVKETLALLQASKKNSSVQIVSAIDESLPEYLAGDPTRIRQILLNLMSNALKFTEEGEVGIRVQLASKQPEESPGSKINIRFEVYDTGIGLTQEQIGKLFQPFVQADSNTTRLYGGTGLGLSICKELVEKMQGEIDVSSEEGQGSTFWFELPLAASTAEAVAQQNPVQANLAQTKTVDSAATKPNFEKLKVLVADDNRVNQTVLKGMLQKLGIDSTIVDNGEAALKEFENQQFDLFFLDCEMPVMDGFQTSQLIREHEKKNNPGHSLPIIALTAHSLNEVNKKCFDAGMDDFLAKPITLPQLVDKIDNHTLKPQ